MGTLGGDLDFLLSFCVIFSFFSNRLSISPLSAASSQLSATSSSSILLAAFPPPPASHQRLDHVTSPTPPNAARRSPWMPV